MTRILVTLLRPFDHHWQYPKLSAKVEETHRWDACAKIPRGDAKCVLSNMQASFNDLACPTVDLQLYSEAVFHRDSFYKVMLAEQGYPRGFLLVFMRWLGSSCAISCKILGEKTPKLRSGFLVLPFASRQKRFQGT